MKYYKKNIMPENIDNTLIMRACTACNIVLIPNIVANHCTVSIATNVKDGANTQSL